MSGLEDPIAEIPRGPRPRRVSVIASASGNGKTTFGRELAGILGVQFVELDALVHGPGWVETPDDVLRAQLAPIIATGGWVIDGGYRHKLGDLVVEAAELVVWLDLPIRIWLPRLTRRTWRRWRRQEPLWNDNRESISAALLGWDSLFVYAFRSHFRSRRHLARELHRLPVVRLRSEAQIERFLRRSAAAEASARAAGGGPTRAVRP